MSIRNCWANRTALEILLILILVISIPFLIGMIVFYVVVPSHYKDKYLHCPTFCDQFTVYVVPRSGQRRVNIDFPKDLNGDTIISSILNNPKQEEICDSKSCENMYPFLIALLNYKYDDDLSEEVFIGTGVLVTQRWALTSGTVVSKYASDRPKIQVRAGSSFWCEGGFVSNVDKVILADVADKETIAVIYLTTSLSHVIPVKVFPHKSYRNNVVFPTYGWNANYSLALRLRKKLISSIKVYVTAFDNDICPEITEGKKFCARPLYSTVYQPCFYEKGFAMVDRNNVLLGIKSGEICRKNQSIHIYHNIAMYVDWIKNITKAQSEY